VKLPAASRGTSRQQKRDQRNSAVLSAVVHLRTKAEALTRLHPYYTLFAAPSWPAEVRQLTDEGGSSRVPRHGAFWRRRVNHAADSASTAASCFAFFRFFFSFPPFAAKVSRMPLSINSWVAFEHFCLIFLYSLDTF